MGYPGEPAYREFHRKDDRSGLRYWRVTDTKTGLGAKEPYSPGTASERVRGHAVHFVGLVRETLARHREERGTNALLTVTFDSELFGHWWFEGVDFIGELYRPEFALLPIGGHFTMGPREAAMAVEWLGVRHVMPLHYGTFPILTGTPDELRAALAERGLGAVEVLAPEPGGTVD